MKKLMMSFIVVLSLSLTGCIQTLNVTTEQSDVLAEYIADLMLKYDKNYNQELISSEELKEQESDTSQTEEKTSDNNENNVDSKSESTKDNSNPTSQDQVTPQPPKKLAEVMNVKYFDIKLSKYGIYDSYPKNVNELVFEARPGKKFLVAELKIKNKATNSKKFNMMSKDISYELNMNSKNTYKSILTLMENDMHYIDTTVGAGKTEIGYLVFEIPKDAKLEKAEIIVTNKDAQASLLLK